MSLEYKAKYSEKGKGNYDKQNIFLYSDTKQPHGFSSLHTGSTTADIQAVFQLLEEKRWVLSPFFIILLKICKNCLICISKKKKEGKAFQ